MRLGIEVGGTKYAGGGVKYYTSGGTWTDRSDLDMYFSINSNNENQTTKQLKDILSQYGQFITNVTIDTDSSITSSSYREGEERAKGVAESLLGQGVSGGNRLLVDIDRNRIARIYQADSNTTITYLMSKDGELKTLIGGRVDKHIVKPGVWVKVSDIPGIGANTPLANLATFFVEQTEYDAMADRLYLTPQTAKGLLEIGGLSEVR